MDRELLLLTQINENECISQRQLARVLEVSLGTVNGLIAQMQQKGCMVVDGSNPKQVKYYLTPQGHKAKALKHYEAIVQSYHTISKTKSQIRNIIESQVSQGSDAFFLYGEEDEVYKLVKMCLMELKREYALHFYTLTDLTALTSVQAYCVLYWDLTITLDEQMNAVNVLIV